MSSKIKSLEEIAELSGQLRADGNKVVLAHGTFDLLHYGHLRHLQLARQQGTVLIVTITSASFVNKGPGRPVFSDQMRSEMLAEMGCVDYVAVSLSATAVEIIKSIQPDIFIKGKEYQNADDDITGGIVEERRAVESFGGKIVFTDDIIFSSSTLINEHLSLLDPVLQKFLEEIRGTSFLADLMEFVEKIEKLKVLVIGDTILDEYNFVTPMGKSPKEHIISSQFRNQELYGGGVIATANHMAAFSENVEVVTTLGEADQYEDKIKESLAEGIKLSPFYLPGRPTTRKARFVDETYLKKVSQIYYMDDSKMDRDIENRISDYIQEIKGNFDLVVLHDFGHGVMTPRLISEISTPHDGHVLAINAQSNSANMGFNLITKYSHADYVCIDLPEARLAVHDREQTVEKIGEKLLGTSENYERLVITNGKYGCSGFVRGQEACHIPAFTTDVVDTVGAGDAFLALSSLFVGVGAPMRHAAFAGNIAGAIKVGILGHRSSVSKAAWVKFATGLLK